MLFNPLEHQQAMSTNTTGRWANLPTRTAFAIHLTLSLLIFSSLVFAMLMWWFPGELFFLDGGWQGLKIVALIDLVLGPLLTLILYKPQKKNLLMDMSLIAAFQLAALGYGFYATHQQRTVAVVYADKGFVTLSADAASVAHQELLDKNETPQVISKLDNSKPAMLFTPPPVPGEFDQYMSQLLGGYPEPHERLDMFEKRGPEHADTLSSFAVAEETLKNSNTDKIVAKAIEKSGYDPADIEIHKFKARYAQGFVLLSKSEHKIVDYVPIDYQALAKQLDAEKQAQHNTSAQDAPDAEESVEAIAETLQE